MSGRKNIKVGEDLFERMKADKGPHKSWPQYFEDQLESTAQDGENSEILEKLDRIEAMTQEATHAAQRVDTQLEAVLEAHE